MSGIGQLARARLWHGLRLVVIDVETAMAPDRSHRIVSIAAITCVKGRITARWSRPLVDPECPIDPVTSAIHGLTDAHVAGAPTFAAVASELLPILHERQGETLVLAAHNARFDIPVVRAELARIGQAIPDLALLDTAGNLAALAGVNPVDRSLAGLLAAMGITNPTAHQALADAEATATAAIALLDRAADAGHDRLSALLATLADGRSSSVKGLRPRGTGPDVEPIIPPAHIATHDQGLPAAPAQTTLDRWLVRVRECAALRCGDLDARIARAKAPVELILPPLIDAVLDQRTPGAAATLLGAILPLLASPPRVFSRKDQEGRAAAEALDTRLGPVLRTIGRCVVPFLCPSCRAGSACPIDVWRLSLAVALFGQTPTKTRLNSYYQIYASNVAGGLWSSVVVSHPELADAGLRLLHGHLTRIDQDERAALIAASAIEFGCRDPLIAEACADGLARPGRAADLAAAIAVCDLVLATRDDNTDEAWRSLVIRRASLAGRRQRLNVRLSDQLDENGALIPIRRHHPAQPRRSRPPRFLRPT